MIDSFLKNKQELKNLPAELQELAADPETTGKINKIIGDFKLDKEQEGRLVEVVLSVIKGEVNLYDAPSAIEEKIKVDFDTALDIDTALYENIFSAVEDMLEAQYAAHKKPAVAPAPVVQSVDIEKANKEKSDFTVLIGKAAAKFNLSFANDDLKSRFFEISDSFLSGARTKTQFKNTLTKDVASGGLEMDKKTADNVAEFLASYSRLEPVIARSEATKQSQEKSPPTPLLQRGEEETPLLLQREEKLPPPLKKEGGLPAEFLGATKPNGFSAVREAGGGFLKSVPPNKKITINPEPSQKSSFTKAAEDREVKKMASQVDLLKTTSKKLLSVTEGVTKALAELNLSFPSAEMNDRLKLICDSRVRSVRNSIQTFEILTQAVPSGGLGLNKEEADKISLVLNKYLEEKNKDIYTGKVAEIKQAEETEKKQWEEKQQAEEEARKKILDEKFTKLTGKEIPLSPPLQKGEEGATTPSVPLPPPKIPSRAVKEEPSRRKKFPGIFGFIGKIFPVFKKEAVPPSSSAVKKNTEEKAPLAPPVIARSKATKQSQEAGDRRAPSELAMTGKVMPVLEDIKFTPKLFGPLEEISRLTLDDFRKLSTDPKEATLKIKDKLSLLRDESFKKYQQGILAWQKSPVYAEFLKILEQGLQSGASLAEILAKSKTLTPDEFDAIINSRIGD